MTDNDEKVLLQALLANNQAILEALTKKESTQEPTSTRPLIHTTEAESKEIKEEVATIAQEAAKEEAASAGETPEPTPEPTQKYSVVLTPTYINCSLLRFCTFNNRKIDQFEWDSAEEARLAWNNADKESWQRLAVITGHYTVAICLSAPYFKRMPVHERKLPITLLHNTRRERTKKAVTT